jgi:hypothetical protein
VGRHCSFGASLGAGQTKAGFRPESILRGAVLFKFGESIKIKEEIYKANTILVKRKI